MRWDFSAVAKKNHQPLVVYGKPLVEERRTNPIPRASEEFFGPHESFVYSGKTVEGCGNNGIKGIYRYSLYLLDISSRTIDIESSDDPQTDNEGDSTSTDPGLTTVP